MTEASQPEQPHQPEQSPLDRRTFLKRAAIGAGAASAVVLAPALVRDSGASPESIAAIEELEAGGPVMVYVRDAARGEAVIIANETERVVTDRVLVSHLLQAQGRHLT
jgi:hypothetical protein